MAGGALTQVDADALLALPKRFVEERTILLEPGSNDTHPLESKTSSDTFLLDLWRGSLRLTKVRYQTRTRTAIVLARLDIDAAPHTNPDGERIGGTHLHVYREGYDTFKTINAPDKNTVSNYLFALSDIRESRRTEGQAHAVLNDRDHKPGGDLVKALEEYGVIPTLWSEREQVAERLAA